MKKVIKKYKRICLIISLLLFLLIFTGCPSISSVDQPPTAIPNTTISVDVVIDPGTESGNGYFDFGILLPNGWSVVGDSIDFTSNNGDSGTVYYDSALSSDMETDQPSGSDYFWWVGRSSIQMQVSDGLTTLDVQIQNNNQTGDFDIKYSFMYYYFMKHFSEKIKPITISENPQIAYLTPSDDGYGEEDSDLVIVFSTDVSAQSGSIIIYNSNDTVFEEIPALDTQVEITNDTVRIDPSNLFELENKYYVTIDNDAFDDGTGKYFSGINDSTTWNFLVVSSISPDTPEDIPYDEWILNEIDVADSGLIIDVNVGIDITHNQVEDLDIYFQSPAGTAITLSSNNGGNGANYTNTIFDDEASTPITNGSPPFTGSFQPEDNLSIFDGMDMNGIWTLGIHDDQIEHFGTLNSWYINIRTLDFYPGTALEFDGIDDYVSADVVTTANNNITMECWVKWDGTTSGEEYILYNGNTASTGYGLYLDNTDYSLNIDCGGVGVASSNSSLEVNEWNHVAMVRNSGNWELYLNGVSLNLSGNPVPNNPLISDNTTFASDESGNRNFQGFIDEICFWDVARTEEEIRESMHKTLRGLENGLVSYWQLNDATTGATAKEKKNDKNGTLVNMDVPSCWVNSTVPTGRGNSNTQQPASTGFPFTIDFTNTDLSMEFNENSSSDSIVVTKIRLSPNLEPTGIDTVNGFIFNNQYWVVNRFSDGNYRANLTFTVTENITNTDNFALYRRESNADWSWEFVTSAANVDDIANQVTFDDIERFGQFLIIRSSTVTIVPEIISNTLWHHNQVNVQDTVSVNNGKTLSVGAGSSVEMQGKYPIFVNGQLLAEGAVGDTITFSCHPDSTASGWGGIIFDSLDTVNDSSKITYAKIEYGKGNGGIIVKDFSKLLIDNCVISYNSADNGGGMSIIDNSSPTIKNSTISNNVSTQYFAGGLMVYDNSSPTIENTVVTNNTGAWHAGGILFHTNANSAINNCTISNNLAGSWFGGGVYCYSSSSPAFTNTIIWGNRITTNDDNDSLGSQVYVSDSGSNPTFTSCDIEFGADDIWYAGGRNNRSTQKLVYVNIYNRKVPMLIEATTHPISQGRQISKSRKILSSPTNPLNRSTIIELDPLFTNPSEGVGAAYNGLTADWTLSSSSPCINSGADVEGIPDKDKYGRNRIGTPDIGSFEFVGSSDVQGISNAPPSGIGYDINSNITTGTILTANSEGANLAVIEIVSGNGSASITVERYESQDFFPQAVDFWWEVNVTGTWTGNLTFYYDDSELSGIFEENLELWHWNGVAMENYSELYTVNVFPDQNKITVFGITQDDCSPFILGDSENPLPIELNDFYAEVIPEGIMLHWSTASELRNKGFYVYRNGERISDLIPGHGTTNELHEYSFLDKNVEPDVLYTYKISDIEENTNIETFHPAITVMADGNIINHKDIPKVFALHTNYPNPFNPETTIEFDLPKDASLQLKIYDVTGKLVRTYADGERWDAGYHSVVWDGKDERGKSLSSGMYFYRMITDEFNQTKQMLLLK